MSTQNLYIHSTNEPMLVTLTNQKIEHVGSAVVQDGHLYLRGNSTAPLCQTNAVFAPGYWLAVQTFDHLQKGG